jgi:8-oxo-dGTP pyrophosphatase MutT (NUDIX family)
VNTVKKILVGIVKTNGKVLILKRSNNEKYDPGRWEFVSGFPKNSNYEEQIEKKAAEETGLEAKITKSGHQFEVNDEYGVWLINPFLLSSTSTDVKLEKSHTDYQWIKPNQLQDFNCVKDLDKNLEALGID